jgi:AraC-like DNA-binding protein
METAFGPLVAELERRLKEAGVALPALPSPPRAAPMPAAYKRALLDAAVARYGPHFVEALGRRLASYVGHPFISALRAAGSPERLLLRWQRLEVLAHSENRVTSVSLHDGGIRLVRRRRSGGAPTLAEDSLIVGCLAGLLEALGADAVRVGDHVDEDVPDGRCWELSWTRWLPTPSTQTGEPWGISSDFARAAFALLLEDTSLPMPTVAQRLHVSPRSFQRRLGEAGTTFRNLVRTARVALAGVALAHGDPAVASLTSVAYACGFADSAHLSREFRALVGVQPSKFLEALRG